MATEFKICLDPKIRKMMEERGFVFGSTNLQMKDKD